MSFAGLEWAGRSLSFAVPSFEITSRSPAVSTSIWSPPRGIHTSRQSRLMEAEISVSWALT